MTQTEIIDKLNSIYPGLDLVEATDPYSSFDAENTRYIVELKSRDKQYRSWVIEKKKFDSNIVKSVEKNKMFVYLTEYKGKIMTWNIHNLVRKGYDFQWTAQLMPQTTEFNNTKPITKVVGFLYEGKAKIHEEEE
tara:strand:- start:618 stop:1022 length:405 start_codon:yes stop_codon:yes gene_type:complete